MSKLSPADIILGDGISYIRSWGFSINEGNTPFNIHISWFDSAYWFYFYMYLFGIIISWMWDRKSKEEPFDEEAYLEYVKEELKDYGKKVRR